MNKHSMCPDENHVCQHAEDETCPAMTELSRLFDELAARVEARTRAFNNPSLNYSAAESKIALWAATNLPRLRELCRLAERPSELADECERESALAHVTASDLLQRAANALRSQPAQGTRWIPVGERLPSETGKMYPVLVGNVHLLRIDAWEEFNGRKKWTNYSYVTHWLEGVPPAPEPKDG